MNAKVFYALLAVLICGLIDYLAFPIVCAGDAFCIAAKAATLVLGNVFISAFSLALYTTQRYC